MKRKLHDNPQFESTVCRWHEAADHTQEAVREMHADFNVPFGFQFYFSFLFHLRSQSMGHCYPIQGGFSHLSSSCLDASPQTYTHVSPGWPLILPSQQGQFPTILHTKQLLRAPFNFSKVYSSHQHIFCVYAAGVRLRALHMLHKHSAIKLQSGSEITIFYLSIICITFYMPISLDNSQLCSCKVNVGNTWTHFRSQKKFTVCSAIRIVKKKNICFTMPYKENLSKFNTAFKLDLTV